MLTQIEIDGFKTFKDFKVELAPFQVIVGPNGSGKSNLFDALQLLSRFASNDLRSAFQDMRGDADDLFTLLPDGKHVDKMRIAVEMLVDKMVLDDLGQKAELKYTRLRYELEVTFVADEYDLERPCILYETLKAIPHDKDGWCRKYGLSSQNGWLPENEGDEKLFINTDNFHKSIDGIDIHNEKAPLLHLYHDEMKGSITSYRAREVLRTLLSSVNNTQYIHAFAAREELRSLRFLYLNPEELRQPSSVKAPSFLSVGGGNLPTMLQRMQREDKFALNDVSRDLANLVPDVVGITLTKDDILSKYTVWVKYMDGRSFPSSVLSDGTLHLLALAALRNDPQFHGVLCIEEPENGVHPSTLKDVAHLLKRLATDFNDPEQVDEPLNQIIITTHSPTFISLPDVIDSLLFANSVTLIEPRNFTLQITQMRPVVTSNLEAGANTNTDTEETMDVYTIDQVIKYLDSQYLDEAHEQLDKARTKMNEG